MVNHQYIYGVVIKNFDSRALHKRGRMAPFYYVKLFEFVRNAVAVMLSTVTV